MLQIQLIVFLFSVGSEHCYGDVADMNGTGGFISFQTFVLGDSTAEDRGITKGVSCSEYCIALCSSESAAESSEVTYAHL